MSPKDPKEKEQKMIDCEEVMRELFPYLDHEVDSETERNIDYHLKRCGSCLSRVDFERQFTEKIREAEDTKASNDLQERIKKMMDKF